MDTSVVIAVANSCWLLKTGDGVGSDFRTANKSVMIKNNLSVAVIVESAHMIGKKSAVFDVQRVFDSLMKHT